MRIQIVYEDETIAVKMTPKEFLDRMQRYVEIEGMSISRAMAKIIDELKKMTQKA